MKIFLTGSTGFVGKRILRDLLENKYQVRCLTRKGSEQKISHYKNPVLVKTGIDIVNGDIYRCCKFRWQIRRMRCRD